MAHNIALRNTFLNRSGLSEIAGRGLLVLLVLGSVAVSASTFVQPPTAFVAKIRPYGWLRRACGTAWCLNVECDLMVTNYHVVKTHGPRLSVNGIKVTHVASATDEHDQGARLLQNSMLGGVKLSWVRDISLLTMAEPLIRKGMHAVPFYLGQLEPGQRISVVGFPGGTLKSLPGKFLNEEGPGLLLLELETDASPGLSGGLVLDDQGRALGLLFAAAEDQPRFVYAVPMWSLADFVLKTKPHLYEQLFRGDLYHPYFHNEGEPVAVDAPQMDWPASSQDAFSPNPVLPESYLMFHESFDTSAIAPRDASAAVLSVRRSARMMSQQMNNFVARERLIFSNGHAWQHELQLIDGRQRFRVLDGSKDRFELPMPQLGPAPGADWSGLVTLIGFHPSIAIRFDQDIRVGNRILKVFRYRAGTEDQVCRVRVGRWFRKPWEGFVPCTGLVWTDEYFHIVRIAEESRLPLETGYVNFRKVLLYGWWEQRLVPVKMYLRAETTKGVVLPAQAKFDNYRVFVASSKIIFTEQIQPQRKVRR